MPMQQNLFLNIECAASLNKNAFLQQLTRNGGTASVLEVDVDKRHSTLDKSKSTMLASTFRIFDISRWEKNGLWNCKHALLRLWLMGNRGNGIGFREHVRIGISFTRRWGEKEGIYFQCFNEISTALRWTQKHETQLLSRRNNSQKLGTTSTTAQRGKAEMV